MQGGSSEDGIEYAALSFVERVAFATEGQIARIDSLLPCRLSQVNSASRHELADACPAAAPCTKHQHHALKALQLFSDRYQTLQALQSFGMALPCVSR